MSVKQLDKREGIVDYIMRFCTLSEIPLPTQDRHTLYAIVAILSLNPEVYRAMQVMAATEILEQEAAYYGHLIDQAEHNFGPQR